MHLKIKPIKHKHGGTRAEIREIRERGEDQEVAGSNPCPITSKFGWDV